MDARHLPKLQPEFYRGRAFVHWTLTVENRAVGWLTCQFHHRWQLILLHTCARFNLACPAYVLMPEHAHFLWLGQNENGSDQRVALEFFRKHLSADLAPAAWQRQSFDHVLREHDREKGAFTAIAQYIFENPVRRGFVPTWCDYEYVGCCVGGYPALNVRQEDYWDLFWRIYNRRCV